MHSSNKNDDMLEGPSVTRTDGISSPVDAIAPPQGGEGTRDGGGGQIFEDQACKENTLMRKLRY